MFAGDIVIGSGPSGVAAAYGLLEKRRRVLLLDVGNTLEADRQRALARYQSLLPEDWDEKLYALLRENTDPSVGRLPEKLVYGSRFPFEWKDSEVKVVQEGVEILLSHAMGGLSNAWGANVLPVMPRDIADWPFPFSELEEGYRAVSAFMPIAAQADELADLYPLYGEIAPAMPESRQARSLLVDLQRAKHLLTREGMHFGHSRLAVEASRCVACGLCLDGCPYGLIYSAAQTIPELARKGDFEYRGGLLAEHFEEGMDGVTVHWRDIHSGERGSTAAERVFVGCGAVSTTALVLASLDREGRELRLKDSQYFLVPFFRLPGSSGVTQEKLHTLSQVSLDIIDERLSPYSFHILLYTFNDLYARAIKRLLGPLARLAQPCISVLLGHLMVLQGYLHSDDSAEVGVCWSKENGQRILRLKGYDNVRTRPLIQKVLRKITRLTPALRGFPLAFMKLIGAPGKSYHLGGSLPMRRTPKPFECDPCGRLSGCRRVYVVDSCSFPSVPSTNITYTIMANAYRIATRVSP